MNPLLSSVASTQNQGQVGGTSFEQQQQQQQAASVLHSQFWGTVNAMNMNPLVSTSYPQAQRSFEVPRSTSSVDKYANTNMHASYGDHSYFSQNTPSSAKLENRSPNLFMTGGLPNFQSFNSSFINGAVPFNFLGSAGMIDPRQLIGRSSLVEMGQMGSTPLQVPGTECTPKKDKKTRRKKPKGYPSRPLSAYNLFFKDERKQIIEERSKANITPLSSPAVPVRGKKRQPHGKIGFENLAKTIGARWRLIDPERLVKYQSLAKEDHERYTEDMKKYEEKLRCLKAKEEQKMKAKAGSPAQHLLSSKKIKRQRDDVDEEALSGSSKNAKIDHDVDNEKTSTDHDDEVVPSNERLQNIKGSNSQKSVSLLIQPRS